MKPAEIKKILKQDSTKLEILAREQSFGCLTADIFLRYEHETWGERRFPTISCQATKITESDLSKPPSGEVFRKFHGYTGFYALKAACVVSMSHMLSQDNESVENAKALFKLIGDRIEEKNLHYVSPDCELSRLVFALKDLGLREAAISVEVNGKSFSEFWYDRNEKIKAMEI